MPGVVDGRGTNSDEGCFGPKVLAYTGIMQRLSGLDASFLYFETPSQLLHVTVLIKLDPSSVPGGYGFEKFKAELDRRVKYMPPLRRKLQDSVLNLDHPVWVEAKDFDIEKHVHRIAVPSPGGEKELGDLAGHFAGIALDRKAPLWEIWVIEGLKGGEIGVLVKMHHSTVDGVSGANFITQLCSLTPDSDLLEEKYLDVNAGGYGAVEVLLGGAISTAAKPFRFVSLLPHTVGLVPKWIMRARKGEAMPAPFSAPRTRFNKTITGHRSIAFGETDLARIKQVKKAFGCTVNDIVLTLAASAMRKYLIAKDELPSNSLVAMVPMSVHGMSNRPGTNHVSGMFMSMATAQEDPIKRLRVIAKSTDVAKKHNDTIDADLLTDWAQFAAPSVFGAAVRMYSKLRLAEKHPTVHNLVISNVPGPDFPLYFLGAKITAMYPMGPVFHGAGLNLTVVSMDGTLYTGFIGCREMESDLWPLIDYMEEALQEYEELAENYERAQKEEEQNSSTGDADSDAPEDIDELDYEDGAPDASIKEMGSALGSLAEKAAKEKLRTRR